MDITEISKSLDAVEAWVERHQFKGYEPFDGLSSWARPLALGNTFCERLLMQGIRQSPWNLRPVLGVKPKDSTKGRGYMAAGYFLRYHATGRKEYITKAEDCLDWLDKSKVPRFKHHSWSNHFDFVSRGGRYTSDDPIIVWTVLIGLAFLDGYEATREDRWLQVAQSVCRWILELPREKTKQGDCLSYLPHVQSSIHNSNMLGAAMLARTAQYTGDREYQEVARSAMGYSCSRQLPDGSWWYGEDPKYHWIDSFHTGYNLETLRIFVESSGETGYEPHLSKGLQFYKDNFFEVNGRPKYYHNRTYPVDIQCAAQAIETLSAFTRRDAACLPLALRVADWTINTMQDAEGFFYYRQYPMGIKAKTPMLHWGQATTYKGLAQAELALSKKPAQQQRGRDKSVLEQAAP